MKFRIERDVLADAVAWTARSLPTRPPVPVLAGVLIETGPAGLTFSSFDYEVSARASARAEVADEGTVLVSGRLLADISRSLPDRPVDVFLDGTKVVLTCGSARFTMLTMPVDDYPALPDLPAAAGIVNGELLAAAVTQTAVAAGRDETLPVLTGIRVEIEGERITIAATDRFRLAVREFSWRPEQPDSTAVALLPARTLLDTAKALAGAGEVTVALAAGGTGDGLVGFEAGGRRTTSRLLDGEFPKYRALLPKETGSVATVDTAALIEAVKRVALVTERNTPVRLAFTQGELVLEAGTGDEAQATEAIAATINGDDIAIAFNPQFLLDGLGALDTPQCQMLFTTPTKPAVIARGPADGEDGSAAGNGAATSDSGGDYRYLLMPIRLSS